MTFSTVKIFWRGLATGFVLQLAIGPVFLYIVNLTLHYSILNGLAAVCAVTIVDYCYIALAISGVGRLLDDQRIAKPLGIISGFVLIAFGLMMIGTAVTTTNSSSLLATTNNISGSFLSAFALTISNPMTIVFFTGIFAAKAVENKFSPSELRVFGLSTGLATAVFMGAAVVLVSFLGTSVPILLMRTLNGSVGVVLIAYGVTRLATAFRARPST